MAHDIHVHIVFGNMCIKLHSNILNICFELWTKVKVFYDAHTNSHDEDTKAMTIARLFFFENRPAKND